jgi:hypothetical protein
VEWHELGCDDFTHDEKYIVQELPLEPAPEDEFGWSTMKSYGVKEVGSNDIVYYCRRSGFRGELLDNIVCGDMWRYFVLSTRTMRFQEHYAGQHVNQEGPADTPFVQIGKCSSFE